MTKAQKKAAAAADKLKADEVKIDEVKADEVKADEVKIDEKAEHDEAVGKVGEGVRAPEEAAQASQSPAPPVSSSSDFPPAPRYKLGVGKPRDGHPRYFTPPPYDVFAKR